MRTPLRLRCARALAALTIVALTAIAAVAHAQEYVKVDNAIREELPAPQFVAAAYGFIWVAILVYVFVVARRLSKTRGEIAELRRRIERAAGSSEQR